MAFVLRSGDAILLCFPTEFPRCCLFCSRQTRPPEWHQRILGLQHRHSALGRGRQRPPEDGGRLPEAAAAQEEGEGAQEAVFVRTGGSQRLSLQLDRACLHIAVV